METPLKSMRVSSQSVCGICNNTDLSLGKQVAMGGNCSMRGYWEKERDAPRGAKRNRGKRNSFLASHLIKRYMWEKRNVPVTLCGEKGMSLGLLTRPNE